MTGHLPPEFFSEFFAILRFSAEDAAAFQEKMNDLCQRKFLDEQLKVLPELEQETFSSILERESVSAETINEFLDQRIDSELQQALWQKSLLYMWQKILEAIGETATPVQKEKIKALVRNYIDEA